MFKSIIQKKQIKIMIHTMLAISFSVALINSQSEIIQIECQTNAASTKVLA